MAPIQGQVRRRKAIAEINVVPYIDVMLVLLVVFMVAAPLLTQGVKIELPKESSEPIKTNEDPIIVTVKVDGTYLLRHGSGSPELISWDALQSRIAEWVKASSSTQVLVEGDKKVAYGEVIHLMSLLQRAGVEHLGLVTDPKESSSSLAQ